LFQVVNMSRDEVKAHLHGILLKLRSIQDTQARIEEFEKMIQRGEADQENFKDYIKKDLVKEIVQTDVEYHNTICSTCSSVCHRHCGLEEITTAGSNQFKRCAAFSGKDNCSCCQEKCSYTVHYHARKNIELVETTLEKVIDEMKAQYDNAITSTENAMREFNAIESSKKALQHEIEQLLKKIDETCLQIKKLVSGFNFAQELHITVDQLKAERTMLTSLASIALADRAISTMERLIQSYESPKRR